MKENSLAKRYALGLIKSIKSEKEYLTLKKELEDFVILINRNDEFKTGMESSLFSKNRKKDLLESIDKKAKFSKKTFNLLLTMIDENRLIILETVVLLLEELWFEKNGIEKLKVLSAVSLNKQLEKKLIKNLEKSFDKKIIIEKEVDESLIAGIKIQRGSVFYDFSINGNLKKLRKAILAETINSTSPAKEP